LIRSPKTGPFRVRVFRDIFAWLRGAEDDESIEVFGRPKGVHSEAGERRCSGCGHLPEAGISQATYFNWKKKYDGMQMQPPEMRRLKQLEDENAKLKKIVADLALDRKILQDVRVICRRRSWISLIDRFKKLLRLAAGLVVNAAGAPKMASSFTCCRS
jgi:putative transposase